MGFPVDASGGGEEEDLVEVVIEIVGVVGVVVFGNEGCTKFSCCGDERW